MTGNIKQAYTFDFVHDAQYVFRELLHAMANPGQITSIREQAETFSEYYAPLTALGCTLLDQEERMYVEKNPKLSGELANLTLCKESDLREADYVFLSSEMNYGSLEEVLRNVKRGTYEDPQESATLFFLCGKIAGQTELTLKGPGISGTITVNINPYIRHIIEIRENLHVEYPLGVDLLFVSQHGEMIGVPRLCTFGEHAVKREE